MARLVSATMSAYVVVTFQLFRSSFRVMTKIIALVNLRKVESKSQQLAEP